MNEAQASQQMRDIGVVQIGEPILEEIAPAFDLPAEKDQATETIERLLSAMKQIAKAHNFAKGMGLAAPQIGIRRAAAAVRPPTPGAATILLLNPRIVDQTQETDEKYEGCLSFFDVRGLVPRPLTITVESRTPEGDLTTVVYERELARLLAHEIDHLNGLVYTARMRSGLAPIPVAEYRQTGQAWAYGQDS